MVNRRRKKSVSEFLSQYKSAGTRSNFTSNLRHFFGHIYSELRELLNKTKLTPEDYKKHDELMDELSIKYVKDLERDFERDIISFRDKELNDVAPNTIAMKFAVIFRYLAINDLEFDKQWKKNVIGAGTGESISKERVPSLDELIRIVYHLPPQAKAMVYVLATARAQGGWQYPC